MIALVLSRVHSLNPSPNPQKDPDGMMPVWILYRGLGPNSLLSVNEMLPGLGGDKVGDLAKGQILEPEPLRFKPWLPSFVALGKSQCASVSLSL